MKCPRESISFWINGPIGRKQFNCVCMYIYATSSILSQFAWSFNFKLFSRFPTYYGHLVSRRPFHQYAHTCNMHVCGTFNSENVKLTMRSEQIFVVNAYGKHKSCHICCFMWNQYVVIWLYVPIIVDSDMHTHTHIIIQTNI